MCCVPGIREKPEASAPQHLFPGICGLAGEIKFQPKRLHRGKKQGIPRIDVGRMSQPDLVEQFAVRFEKVMQTSQAGQTATEKWATLRDTMHSSALATFGRKTSKSLDWFEAKSAEMTPVLDAKRAALAEYKRSPSEKNLQILRAARSKAQQTARRCTNEYWTELSVNIQTAAITGNIKEMYNGIKMTMGPAQNKTAPLKSTTGEIITDKGQQMQRWVEHYSELYSRQNVVTSAALNAIERLPVLEELDTEPTIEDLSKAIDSLASEKAPGSDGIPPDLIKHCKTTLLLPLHEVLCQCWKEGAVPQDMRDAKIVTLYKNKGERNDCNNYRGISLLSIVGKVILARLQKLVKRVYPESQCGFRAERSTVDMVFSLRQLQEKCREQQMPLYVAFIDLTKAFDLVSREGLFKILPKIGCPPKLQSLIESFHSEMQGTVQFNGSTSEPFNINSGVKQGCVLAPTLFGIFFALLLKHAFRTSSEGIYLRTRSDGRLFNLACLRAKTKVREALIRDMLFADDAAVATHTQRELQTLMDHFSQACKDFGLTISLKKTNVLGQGTESPPTITINDYELDAVHQFTYLGSTIADNLSLDAEIDERIGKAAITLGRLTTRVWTNPKLTSNTKMAVYNACVVSTLLYSSETWTTYATQEKHLNTFHVRSIRRILGISWQDKVPNTEVLSRVGLPSMYTLLRRRRLRWLGHVHRMPDGRIPKDLLYGRPSKWRGALTQHLKSGEEKLSQAATERRARRKQSDSSNRPDTEHKCDFCNKDCHSRIGLFSHRRRCSSLQNATHGQH
ncbi:uncharacterized protein LOC134772300 [Penaeus indicus]|uniref:uncharacterized protein LOC134772300 n=1 Tax=Penaeus indicus TaxID=29960 RepID=UPI00300C3216